MSEKSLQGLFKHQDALSVGGTNLVSKSSSDWMDVLIWNRHRDVEVVVYKERRRSARV